MTTMVAACASTLLSMLNTQLNKHRYQASRWAGRYLKEKHEQ